MKKVNSNILLNLGKFTHLEKKNVTRVKCSDQIRQDSGKERLHKEFILNYYILKSISPINMPSNFGEQVDNKFGKKALLWSFLATLVDSIKKGFIFCEDTIQNNFKFLPLKIILYPTTGNLNSLGVVKKIRGNWFCF